MKQFQYVKNKNNFLNEIKFSFLSRHKFVRKIVLLTEQEPISFKSAKHQVTP